MKYKSLDLGIKNFRLISEGKILKFRCRRLLHLLVSCKTLNQFYGYHISCDFILTIQLHFNNIYEQI